MFSYLVFDYQFTNIAQQFASPMFQDQQEADHLDQLYPPGSIMCPDHNKARMFCRNSECKSSAMICFKNSCSTCMDAHSRCKTLRSEIMLEQIARKQQKFTPTIQRSIQTLEGIYDNAIEKLSIDKENLRENLKFLGFNKHEMDFFKKLSEWRQDDVKGKEISLILENILQTNRWGATSMVIQNFWKEKENDFKYILQGLRTVISYETHKIDSEIVDTIEVVQELFPTKKIYKMDLLFRARDHNYSMESFYQIAKNKKNSLILAKTQHGEVLGAFLGVPWKINGSSKDKNRNSFLFSISKDLKYAIDPSYKGEIVHFTKEGFGIGEYREKNYQFFIADQSRQYARSHFDFGGCFQNEYAPYKTLTACNREFLSGDPRENVDTRVVEWEVFTILFG